MASIDNYLRSMERFSATALVLRSDANIVLSFPSGDRQATQQTPHLQLQSMIRDIAPDEARMSIERGRQARFDYSFEGKTYAVSVEPSPAEWVARVEPGSAAAPAPEVEPASGAAFEIERTQYSLGDTASAGAPAARAEPRRNSWIDEILTRMKRDGASDLHLSTGSPPYMRLHGEIKPIDGMKPLEADWLLDQLMDISPQTNKEEFEARSDSDFAYAIPGVSRFRVNLFRDRNGPGAVFRAIPFEIPSAKDLGLPKGLMELCDLTKGLVLVTGPTGSGKSTTLAAMVDHINNTRSEHMITIEDPIEFIHENKKCLVNQREVHTHTQSFKDALRAALREDPDIVLVGEMRDLETIAIAIETAETGHLVFGTLHTTTAPSTVDRIIDQFPADRQEQIRQMLSKSLRGVCAQVLCRKVGGGRVAAQEILLGTSAVENLIREKKTFQLASTMQTGRNMGMQTMADALMALVVSGQVEPLEAYRKSTNKAEFKQLLARNNINI